MPSLDEAFSAQKSLQHSSYNTDVTNLSEEDRAEFIRWNVLALTDELHEALAEVGWKPWATSRHLNREQYKGELVDAFHFLINLCLAANITSSELLDGYFVKRERNAKRQSDGYTGLSKCPGCKRAWDDIHTLQLANRWTIEGVVYCSRTCAQEATSSR